MKVLIARRQTAKVLADVSGIPCNVQGLGFQESSERPCFEQFDTDCKKSELDLAFTVVRGRAVSNLTAMSAETFYEMTETVLVTSLPTERTSAEPGWRLQRCCMLLEGLSAPLCMFRKPLSILVPANPGTQRPSAQILIRT